MFRIEKVKIGVGDNFYYYVSSEKLRKGDAERKDASSKLTKESQDSRGKLDKKKAEQKETKAKKRRA